MVTDAFWQAFGSVPMQQALDRALSALPESPKRIAVALSAEADSAMLAVHAALHARRRGIEVHCIPVHHGLQETADHCQDHPNDLAHLLSLECHRRLGRECSNRERRV